MSELAFNVNGERFDLPDEASHWRVRRFKPSGRGTPDVVFGTDGLPLIIPIDTDIAEFRSLVNSQAGRYRLDAMDDDHKSVESTAAYIQLSSAAPTSNDASASANSNSSDGELMREIVRTNAEMVRTIAEKFATVMDSAAGLLRAADGAGMPQRKAPASLPPLVLERAAEPRNAAPAVDTTDDDDGDDDGNQVADILRNVAEQTMPLVQHMIHTKFMGLTPEQSLALMGGAAAAPVASAQSPADDRSNGADHSAAEPHEQRNDAAAAPPPPPNFLMHLAAIEQLLTAEESRLIRAVIKQADPAALAAWKDQLLQLSPEQAVQLVRAELERLVAATQTDNTTTDTSDTDSDEEAA